MTEPTKIDKDQARAEFAEISARKTALNEEAYQRSADGTFTAQFGAKLERELAELTVSLAAVTKAFVPQVEHVEPLLGGRLLVASDYNKYMPNLSATIAPEGWLPLEIFDVLNRQSPVHEAGVLVKDSHMLAWVPNNLSLNMLSEALGGEQGKVLWANWFTNGQDPLGDIKLQDVEQSGHWALIPDRFPGGTEEKGIFASAEALRENYGEFYLQPDVISFTAPLLLHAMKNETRMYDSAYAWCRDPREGTPFENESCFGGGRSSALAVGDFNNVGLFLAGGLRVDRDDPGRARAGLGCAAVWNFGTRPLES